MVPDVIISTDRSLLDVPLIERMLHGSYWAAGRPRDVIERSIANAICFGAYDTAGHQVAFGRVITDRAVFAYLSDVFVVPQFRGRGVGKALLRALVEASERAGVWTLQGAIFPENVASLALVTGCWFRELGRRERIGCMDGVWRDTILVERWSRVVGA